MAQARRRRIHRGAEKFRRRLGNDLIASAEARFAGRSHPPPAPPQLAHLLDWYGALEPLRPLKSIPVKKGGAIISPLAATEVESWARLNGIALKPYEADLLLRLDRVRVSQARQSPRLGHVPISDSAAINAMLPGRKAPPGPKPSVTIVKPKV